MPLTLSDMMRSPDMGTMQFNQPVNPTLGGMMQAAMPSPQMQAPQMMQQPPQMQQQTEDKPMNMHNPATLGGMGGMPPAGGIPGAATLGGMMNAGAHPAKKGPLGLSKDQWAAMLAALSDAAYRHNGIASNNLGAFMQQQENERDREAKIEESMRPHLEQVGNTLGWANPATSSYSPIFTAPSAPEQYAAALGFEPGSEEFKGAVKDYRLGSWSDPAMENRLNLEGVRYENRDSLQDQRLNVTRRGQDLRHTDTTRGQNLTHTDRQAMIGQSNTNNVRSTQTSRDNAQLSAQTRAGRGRHGASVGDGAVIVNPTTGEKMKLSGGQWVPAK